MQNPCQFPKNMPYTMIFTGQFAPVYHYFLAALRRKSESISTQLAALLLRTLPLPKRVLLVIDGHRPKGGPPTKRYEPKVEGADVHHNPTPGPADQPYLHGHIWVTISLALRHLCGAGEGRSQLVRLLLHRPTCQRPGDSRSVCRSRDHRAGLPRCEGCVGSGQ